MKLKKGSAAAKAFMAKIRAKRKKNTKVGATKKATIKPSSKKKAAKKAPRKKVSSVHKDTASHNVKISVMSGNIFKFSAEEYNFLKTESKNSKGYKYRAKVLWGAPIVLKETEKGSPVQKWEVDDFDTALALSKELNNGYKLSKVKTKKLK